MFQQFSITFAKLAILGQVVDRRAKTVGAMASWRSAQLPQGILQAAAESFERLGVAKRDKLPIGIGEREVKQQVVQRLPSDGDVEGVHVGKVHRR